MRQTRRVVSSPERITARRGAVHERVVETRSSSSVGRSPVWGSGFQEVGPNMGIGVSVFLVAVGAILTFAVKVTTEGVNIHTVGVILMSVGLIGLLFSMLFWSSFAPFGSRDREVITEREVVGDSHTHLR